MARKSTKSQGPELDLSDVDHRVGKPIGGVNYGIPAAPPTSAAG